VKASADLHAAIAAPVEPASQMAREPRILVLLAAYNGAPWVRDQIKSILAQQAVDVHIIVRDDGSSDDTRTQVERIASQGRIRLQAAPAPGGSAAQNFFALIRENPAVGFDFVALADQDDLWNADKLSRASRLLTTERSAGYSSWTTAVWPDGRETVLRQVGVPTESDFLFEGTGQGCTFVLSAEFYERARQFLLGTSELTRSIHYHDWALYALARSWGLRWSFDPHPTVRYRQHGGNDTGARYSANGLARRLRLIREGWYRQQLCAIADLALAANPSNPTACEWRGVLAARNRLRTAGFCLRGGRRKGIDNTVLVLAALAGWI
jgi:rhamnosyltransferase